MTSTPRTPIRIRIDGVNDAQIGGQIVSPRGVGGQTHRVRTHAVISVAQGQNVVISSVDSRHHHGHIVGFGTRIDEIADFEIARQSGGEPSGVLVDLRIEINGGRVPKAVDLGVQSGVDFRVTMADADGDDAAEKVQISFAARVPEPLHGTPMDVQRARVVVSERWTEILPADRNDFRVGKAWVVKEDAVYYRLYRGHGDRKLIRTRLHF